MLATASKDSLHFTDSFPGETGFFGDTFENREGCNDGLNWYVYVSNNPVNRIDPMGLADKDVIIQETKVLVLGILEMGSGTAMIGAAAAGEIGSVGLSTPASIAVGAAGVSMLADGAVRAGVAALKIVDEIKDVDLEGRNVVNDMSSNIAGNIADMTGGDVEKAEKVNDAVTLGLSIGTAPISIYSAETPIKKTLEIVENTAGIADGISGLSSDNSCGGKENE